MKIHFGVASRAAVAALMVLASAALLAPQARSAPAPSTAGYTLFGKADRLPSVTYQSFRIPAIIRTRANALVAFAEGRVADAGDLGNVDLVMKTSTDNGNTWSALKPVATGLPATFGNPTPVYEPNVDPSTGGTVFLFAEYTTAATPKDYTYANRAVELLTRSVGVDGVPSGAWTIKNMNSTLKPTSITGFDAVGPGTGIRLTHGPYAGALVIPALGRLFYSLDRGTTWRLSMLPSTIGAEGTVAERLDGSLYMNYRGTASHDPYRLFTTGPLTGGFAPWDCHNGPHDTLTEPLNYTQRGTTPVRPAGCADTMAGEPPSGCEGSTIRYNSDAPNRLLFLHPAAPVLRHEMRVSISYDNGGTWDRMYRDLPSPHWTDAGHVEGGYSSMTGTSDHHVAALVEAYQSSGKNFSIVYHKFTIAWIVNGRTEPTS